MWHWRAASPRVTVAVWSRSFDPINGQHSPIQRPLTAAPSRPSAARRSSSVTALSVASTRATSAASSVGGAALTLGRDSGAWRSAIRPTACQPKKRLIRSRITADWCWISIATGPSTRSTRVAGSRRLAVDLARPLQLDRLGVGRDFGADDVLPARHQFGRREALLAERVRHELRCEFGELADGAGLVHGVGLYRNDAS